jgi:hypothetical protein
MIEQASLIIGEGNWAVKSDNLLGYKLLNGGYYPREIDVTRATTGTRVNADGLVELVPYNLVTYSEQFDNSDWIKYESTITANNIIAPNGTLTADKFADTSVNGVHVFYRSAWDTTQKTFSIYAKEGTSSKIFIQNGTTGLGVYFNLSTQSIVTDTGFTGAITNVNDGWFRLSVTHTAAATQTLAVGLFTGTSTDSYIGTGSYVYIWGAQLVDGSVAKDYLPTTDRLDVARIDYSSGSGALLVEPQRTNIFTYSSSFDNSAWPKYEASITANNTTAPDGTTTADKVIPSTANDAHGIERPVTGAAQSFSVYAKAGEYSRIALLFTVHNAQAKFNLINGTVISTSGTVTASIEDAGNGWYRCIISTTLTTHNEARIYVLDNSSNFNYIGNGTNGLFIWGAQLEAGSYATSYIPTTSASVTRNADVISKTGISSLIGQTEGTLFCEVLQMGGNTIVPFQLSDTTNSNRAQIEISGVGAPLCVVSSGGVNTAVIVGSYVPFNQYHKIAVTYKANEFKLYVNGALVGTDTSGAVPISLSAVYIGSESGTTYAGFEMKSAVHWKQVLTNDQLISLTTI